MEAQTKSEISIESTSLRFFNNTYRYVSGSYSQTTLVTLILEQIVFQSKLKDTSSSKNDMRPIRGMVRTMWKTRGATRN